MKAIIEFITSYEDIGLTLWFIIPGIFGLMIGYTSMQYAENSKTWPETVGRVISVKLEKNSSTGIKTPGSGHSSGHTSYKPLIKYEYYVMGIKYESTNLSFNNTGFSDQRKVQNILNGFKPDQYVNVYYKPDDPRIAVLNRGSDEIPIPLIVGIVFTVLSVPLFIIAVFNRLKRLIAINN